MADVQFDSAEGAAVVNARHDPWAAGECLRLFAARLRRTQPEYDFLAKHFASAFESAARAPASKRAKVLTDALGLTASRKRAAANWFSVGREAYSMIDDGQTKTATLAVLADRYDIDKRTAGRYLDRYIAKLPEWLRLMRNR